MTIYKTLTFDSAHLLKGHPKCGKLHGHTYKAEVWLTSDTLTEDYGFVFDFHFVKDYFQQFDHSDIVITTSCERMVRKAVYWFSIKLMQISKDGKIKVKVRLWETPTSYAEDEASYE